MSTASILPINTIHALILMSLGLIGVPSALWAQATEPPSTEFVVPPPPPPPSHPMAQVPGMQSEPEDLRSPRQKLYEHCLDRMADFVDAPDDFVQKCLGEQPATINSGTIESSKSSQSVANKKITTPRHLAPGFSAKTLSKHAEALPAIVSSCFDQLVKNLGKRGLFSAGDTLVTVFVRDNGKVESVNVDESEIVDDKFLTCIEKSIAKSWKLPPSRSAEEKRNALNAASIILSFESHGQGQSKNKITQNGTKRVQVGGLSSTEIARSLGQQASQLRSCQVSTLPSDVIAARKASGKPNIALNMDVEFIVNEFGKVSDLQLAEQSSTDMQFRKCISDRISSWLFSKPRGKQKTLVVQSLKLTAQ